MAIIDLNFDRKTVISVEDYGKIIADVLQLKVSFTIVHYMLTEHGVVMRISVPDEKLKEVRDILHTHKIKTRNSTITINEDLCVSCGACVSLCNSEAIYFDKEYKRCFDPQKCVGCKLCVDTCPRRAISFE